MKCNFIIGVICGAVLGGCSAPVERPSADSDPVSNSQMESVIMSKELIVLGTPPEGDTYYSRVVDEIFDFHVAYAKAIISAGDDVLILATADNYDDYVSALGERYVLAAPNQDIWMRDFSLSNAADPVMFRYTSEGQGGGRKGQKESNFVQKSLVKTLANAPLTYRETALLNDGGNFVDDYAGNVVISRKFLRDNELTEAEGRVEIKRVTGSKNVAFIEADEQGGLEHADGVVAFIGENVLVINRYDEDPDYANVLKADLRAGLPEVTIHEIVTPYDGSQIYDARFGSACGLYTNMLVTPKRIYFPQFGIDEDAQAIADMRRWTDKEIVPISSAAVCPMGGGVRCMSWQLRGENAQALKALAPP